MTKTEKELIDSIKVAVFILEPDENGRPVYTYFNRLGCDTLAYTLEEIVGLTAVELYPGPFGQAAYARHCEVASSGESLTYDLQLPIRGHERQVRTHLIPNFDNNGNLVRLVGSSTDITAEHAVREAQEKSEILNAELAEFFSLAAHDLRSPIRNIRAVTDILLEDFNDLGDGKLELIKMLEKIAVKTTLLISDVIGHAQATGSTEVIERFELSALCRDILGTLDPAEDHRITVSNCLIVADKIAIQIVLRNLLDNAIKHNAGRSISMRVSVESFNSEMYKLTVKDDGAGFADPAVAFLGGGKLRTDSGFGLLGIRQLVRSRGGEISAEKPRSGTGATVKFTLPGQIVDQFKLVI